MSNYIWFFFFHFECLSITPFSIGKHTTIYHSTIHHHLHTFRHKLPLMENVMVHISVTDFYWFVNKKKKNENKLPCLRFEAWKQSLPGPLAYAYLGLNMFPIIPGIWNLDNNEQKMTTEIKWCTKLHFQFRFKLQNRKWFVLYYWVSSPFMHSEALFAFYNCLQFNSCVQCSCFDYIRIIKMENLWPAKCTDHFRKFDFYENFKLIRNEKFLYISNEVK